MPSELHQMNRLVQLHAWLRAGRRFTAAEAARHFGVSRRTVVSDLDALRRYGVLFHYDAVAGRYVLEDATADLPFAHLSRRDFAALVVAQHALAEAGSSPHADALAEVVDRLADLLPETVRVAPQTITAQLRLGQGQPSTPARPRFQIALHNAIEARRVVVLRYHSASKDEVTERRAEPLALVEHQRRWYLVAFCHLRSDLRDFRLDRIEALEVTRAEAAPRDFDLDAYLESSFGMHRGDRTYSVHLRFSPYQARWICEEQWHPTQVLTRLADGRLDLRVQTQGLGDLTRWVMSYGGEVEVLAPAILRHRVAQEARRMAEQYSPQTSSHDDAGAP